MLRTTPGTLSCLALTLCCAGCTTVLQEVQKRKEEEEERAAKEAEVRCVGGGAHEVGREAAGQLLWWCVGYARPADAGERVLAVRQAQEGSLPPGCGKWSGGLSTKPTLALTPLLQEAEAQRKEQERVQRAQRRQEEEEERRLRALEEARKLSGVCVGGWLGWWACWCVGVFHPPSWVIAQLSSLWALS